VIAGGVAGILYLRRPATSAPASTQSAQILERARVDGLVVALLGAEGSIAKGRSTLGLEFRSDVDDLIDVGDVRLTGTMAMPGMTMTARTSVARTSAPGRYRVTCDFPMTGVWQLTVEWNSPARQGTAVMNGEVR
jgi:hypothetical protein